MSPRTGNFQADQITSAFINQINNNRFLGFQEAIVAVERELAVKLSQQEIRILEALASIDVVRDFVANPSGILGSMQTKHGEIAEQVEVGIRNARNILRDENISATFEGVGRTAPEDYIIGDFIYQSKFINSTRNTLDHVLRHMDKYEDFRLGDHTKYHIPKDQYEIIKKIINGEEIEGLHSRTIRALKSKIIEIEEASGGRFFDKIEAGDSALSEVQMNTVGNTLNKHEANLSAEDKNIKKEFKEQAKNEAEKLNHLKDPTFGEALKAGAIGGGVAGAMKLGFSVYRKHTEDDKRIYEYTKEDWQEIGLDVGKSSFKGGISGTGIYALTNFAYMPAPVAGGYVTAAFSTVDLVRKYKKDAMDFEDFLVESESICIEAGLTMSCALIGQAVIPIPVIGAIVGSVVGAMMTGPIIDKMEVYLTGEEEILIKEYYTRYEKVVTGLVQGEREYYNNIMERFNKYEELEELIFDQNLNSTLRLHKSAELAEEFGVHEGLILRDVDDVDLLFM